jgi:hypothetical protein
MLLGAAVPWIGRQPITLSSSVVLSVVALGVLSTGVAYVLNSSALLTGRVVPGGMTVRLAGGLVMIRAAIGGGGRDPWND